MANRTIVTSYVNPPIPVRQYDWCAHYEGEEEAGGYGYGATEQEAIDDFQDNHQADHDERLNSKSSNKYLQGEWKAHVGWSDDPDDVRGTLKHHPDWCEVTGPAYLSINGHFGIEVARIIAAAPNVFAALKALLPEIDAEVEQRQTSGNDEYWQGLKALSDAAHAAVRKAEGR